MKTARIGAAWRIGRELWQHLGAELFEREGLSTLFQHARNVLSGSLIIAAGLYASHHRPRLPAPALWTVQFAGHVVTVVGVLLLVLNLIDGLRRLSRRGYPLLLHAVAALAYFGITVRLVQVLAYFRAPL